MVMWLVLCKKIYWIRLLWVLFIIHNCAHFCWDGCNMNGIHFKLQHFYNIHDMKYLCGTISFEFESNIYKHIHGINQCIILKSFIDRKMVIYLISWNSMKNYMMVSIQLQFNLSSALVSRTHSSNTSLISI